MYPRESPLYHNSEAIPALVSGVVIVHYGDPNLVQKCLESLARIETAPHFAVVVNHGPSPDLGEQLGNVHPDLHVLERLDNPGFAAGCNAGAEEALRLGAWGLWFLNPDCELKMPMLDRLAEFSKCNPGIALWGTLQDDGARRYGADTHPAWVGQGSHYQTGPPEGCRLLANHETLSGASMFISRQHWKQLGPWPEFYFLYWEDVAWCARAHRLGLGIALVDTPVLHHRSATTGRRSRLSAFYGMRNLLLLHAELHPRRALARWVMGLHALQKRFFRGQWRVLSATWQGWRAGLAGRRNRDLRY